MNFDPGLEQLRGDQATFESAQELSHIFSYNLRPKKLFLVWVDFPALCLKVAIYWPGNKILFQTVVTMFTYLMNFTCKYELMKN